MKLEEVRRISIKSQSVEPQSIASYQFQQLNLVTGRGEKYFILKPNLGEVEYE